MTTPEVSPSPMFRPWQSFVPGAVSALVDLCQDAVAGSVPPVEVHDGMWLQGGTDTQVLVIGWNGFYPGYQYPSRSMSEELGGTDVASTNRWAGLGPSIIEEFTITCASMCRRGDVGEIPTARAIAYQNTQIVGGLIRPPWFGGISKAVMGEAITLHQLQDRRGVLAVVGFSIMCTAFAQQ